MRKSILALVLGGALGMPAMGQAQGESPHSFSPNVGLYSNYLFRAISQTAGDPALQGGFDYAHSSGIYLGTWASNVSWPRDFGADTRLAPTARATT